MNVGVAVAGVQSRDFVFALGRVMLRHTCGPALPQNRFLVLNTILNFKSSAYVGLNKFVCVLYLLMMQTNLIDGAVNSCVGGDSCESPCSSVLSLSRHICLCLLFSVVGLKFRRLDVRSSRLTITSSRTLVMRQLDNVGVEWGGRFWLCLFVRVGSDRRVCVAIMFLIISLAIRLAIATDLQ